MTDAAEILSRFSHGLKYSDLPREVTEQTKLYIADYLAAVYAGCRVNAKFNEATLALITEDGGRGEAVPFITDKRMTVRQAAYMNAIYAHGADLDDGNKKAMGHAAAHIMSAVFALAQTLDVTWGEVFTAINVGYEVYNRTAAAVQPGLVHRGFHSTGTAGALACGAACAKLMGLDEKQIYSAIAISAVQASGLIIIAESGQSCKPLNPANAAVTGITSAKLAARGIEGPKYPLNSGKGWFHAMSDELNESLLYDGLGSEFTIMHSYLKPYPSCRHTHCGIECAARIRARLLADGYGTGDIADIAVNIYENAIRIAGQISQPVNADEAKFSIHYSLARAMLSGDFALSDLHGNISDAERELIGKIRLIPDAAMENVAAGIRGACVTVTLADGKSYTEKVSVPKGDAENPFTWEDMEQKMLGCMSGAMSPDAVRRLCGRIRSIEPEEKFTQRLVE